MTKLTELLIHQWLYFRGKKPSTLLYERYLEAQRLICSSSDRVQGVGMAVALKGILVAFLIVPCLQGQVELHSPSMYQAPYTFLLLHKAKGYLSSWSELKVIDIASSVSTGIFRINTYCRTDCGSVCGGSEILRTKFCSSFCTVGTLFKKNNFVTLDYYH